MAQRAFSSIFVRSIRCLSTKPVNVHRCVQPQFKVRPFLEDDIPDVIKIARQNTFQYSEEILKSWLKYDPEGINVAVLDSGEVIGLCSSINYSNDFSFGGAFCVLEKYRYLEIGHKIFQRCFVHAGGRNIVLNSTTELVNSYKRRGFPILEDSFSSLEYEHFGKPLSTKPLSEKLPDGVEIKKLEDAYFDDIFAYDRSLMGYDRKDIIKASCKEANAKTFVAFKNSICVGYGCVKLNMFEASRVGPLYANDSAVAEVMLRRLIENMPEAKGFVMTSVSNNMAANGFMRKLGIPVHNSLFRMYTKEKMIVNTSKIFAQFDIDFSPF
ncbi:n-acetyltransferase domain-containing protein [Nephila pilipes]|uniref:N-acetyltransferase domain-containing protein n=1 Tax=Nephila pilipes TaxID=299642 RepID=A0A8X6TS33_NEPPI|nr:n-acetyltransferase domain-containing protein [Nephila pilipes]